MSYDNDLAPNCLEFSAPAGLLHTLLLGERETRGVRAKPLIIALLSLRATVPQIYARFLQEWAVFTSERHCVRESPSENLRYAHQEAARAAWLTSSN